MKYFNGNGVKKNYFEGWYFKHQINGNTIAFIPGVCVDKHGDKRAFIQIITNDGAYKAGYDYNDFYADEDELFVRIGENEFSLDGIKIDIETKNFQISGDIRYGEITALEGDIMGPFAKLKCMPCSHGIISLHHNLLGNMQINGKKINFDKGIGYIEKNWGSSFPEKYMWVQCNSVKSEKICLFAAAAKLPVLGFGFDGCICAVLYKNKQYILATYNGAKFKIINRDKLLIYNKSCLLEIGLKRGGAHTLLAPKNGEMARIIEECISGGADFNVYVNGIRKFSVKSKYSSYETVLD